jgi:hypothetical protein
MMATIVNNSKYGEGHEVILKDPNKMPTTSKLAFTKYGFEPGVSVFKVSRNADKADVTINLGAGKDSVYLKDGEDKIYQVIGSASAINGSFNHNGNSDKAKTNLLTEVKELVSMWMFEKYFETGNFIEEDEIYTKLGPNKESYKTVYYESALKQLAALKPYVKEHIGYTYERQGQDRTKKLYITARKLTRKLNDNWNPADIWMIRSSYDMDELYYAINASELNSLLADAVERQDIIPISLKQIVTPSAKLTVVDAGKQLDSDVDLDFSLKEIQLSSSFANFMVVTKSKFTVRGGFKSSGLTLSVSLEGKMMGTKYQLGAIDARWFATYVQSEYDYNLKGGTKVDIGDLNKAKGEFRQIVDQHGMPSSKIASYDKAIQMVDDADDLTKRRFIALISYLYALTVKPGNNFKTLMKHCYFSAKKISSDASVYVLIS